jgi:hypothetical protein
MSSITEQKINPVWPQWHLDVSRILREATEALRESGAPPEYIGAVVSLLSVAKVLSDRLGPVGNKNGSEALKIMAVQLLLNRVLRREIVGYGSVVEFVAADDDSDNSRAFESALQEYRKQFKCSWNLYPSNQKWEKAI